jgi:hypothetical protein
MKLRGASGPAGGVVSLGVVAAAAAGGASLAVGGSPTGHAAAAVVMLHAMEVIKRVVSSEATLIARSERMHSASAR